jgi:hypothetical protein
MAQSTIVANIYKTIRSLGIVKHKKRQEFTCDLIEGMIQSRSVVFSELADKIESSALCTSVERRIQDYFEKVNFDYLQLGVFLMSFVAHQDLVVSIDRTEWDFGKTQINILCAAVCIGKMAVPLYFELLDNKSGNSNSEDRIRLFQSLLGIVGQQRIAMLVMDREFIGHKWLAWLKQKGIPFCVRVPKHHQILSSEGDYCTAEELLEDKKSYYATEVVVDTVVVNLSLSYGHNGELLYLIGTSKANELASIYKKRWTIEVFFQALKGRGFHIEKSGLKDLEKYRKLFAVVVMTYTICWATGIEAGKTKPVKPKKHGYPQYSVFRRGLNLMRQFYKQKILEPLSKAILNAMKRIGLITENQLLIKTIG